MKWLLGVLGGLVALLGALAIGLVRKAPPVGQGSPRQVRRRQKLMLKQVTHLVRKQQAKEQIQKDLKGQLEKSGSLKEAKALLEEARRELGE